MVIYSSLSTLNCVMRGEEGRLKPSGRVSYLESLLELQHSLSALRVGFTLDFSR